VWTGDRSLEESANHLRTLRAAISRSRWLLLAWVLAWMGFGLAYAVTVKPEFVGKVQIAIGPRHIADDGPEDERHYHQLAFDSEQAETELRELRSERLLRPVFDELHLAEAPELSAGRNGFWSEVAHWLHRLSPNASSYDARTRAFATFIDRVRCLRLGLSYVIEVSYRSPDPRRAAQVANAVGASYLGDRLMRVRAHFERTGGEYRAARASDLAAQIEETHAALREGIPLGKDMDFADARLLGAAAPPLVKAYPKIGPSVVFAWGFGLISGILLVLVFRTRA
jgi:uncharacterized protein involved in exopolysaccharide biosynthesis